MPKTISDRIGRLHRILCSPDRFVDSLLEVRLPDGELVLRVGGCWDRHLKQYVDRPCKAYVVTLQESQIEMGRALGRWIEARLADGPRPKVLMAGGNRGGGKTWLCALAMIAIALAVPGCWQFVVNITSKQRREVLDALGRIAPQRWITANVDDFRDARTQLVTGSMVSWLTAKNPAALRQAGLPIENIFINEGQDQPRAVFTNAISAIRNGGGVVTIATNPPQHESGDWVAVLQQTIEAGGVAGEYYNLEASKNLHIHQESMPQIAALLRAVDQSAYEADALGEFRLSGDLAYPGFSAQPLERGGHIGDPPWSWKDVTRELSAEAVEGATGFDYVAGADFQRTPGSCAPVGKLYRTPEGKVLLWIYRFIATGGTEQDLSQAFIGAGLFPGSVDSEGKPASSLLLVGDATGARQNAEHHKRDPYSFVQLRSDGWHVVPPMYHWRNYTPWNPLVIDSRRQMHALFEAGQILFSPRCNEAQPGFPTLIESFRRAKVRPDGGFERKGHFTHGPDGVRYLAWRFLPRAKPPPFVQPAPDLEMFKLLSGIRFRDPSL